MKLILFFLCLIALPLRGYELGIVTMFRNEEPYLKEWVEYHLIAGVEHFWMYNNSSTDNWQKVLDPYIKKGIVEVFPWPESATEERLLSQYYGNQIGAFKDGLKKALGKAKWVALIDLDEFLLPMKGKSVPDVLNTYFSDVAEVFVNWRMFGTNGVTVPKGKPLLNKLTACSRSSHYENLVGKSIVRPEKVAIDSIWYCHHFPLLPGAKVVDGRKKALHFTSWGELIKENGYFDQYIRINHYHFRDEHFYHTYRLVKHNPHKPLARMKEQYAPFNALQDRTILNFIWSVNPAKYNEIWKD